MSARIVIVDSDPANCILLKVKMLSAQFMVETCTTLEQAAQAVNRDMPDVVLLNIRALAQDALAFCKQMRGTSNTAHLAMIGVLVPDTPAARIAALEAGLDDILPGPICDQLLLARVRSLLRARSLWQDLAPCETSAAVLGFDEARAPFAPRTRIKLLAARHAPLAAILRDELASAVTIAETPVAVLGADHKHPTDLFVFDATAKAVLPDADLFGLVADLRARSNTRAAGQVVIVPQDKPAIAAMFLDLGVDEVISDTAPVAEIALRVRKVLRLQAARQQLRTKLRNGLRAAMIDPLTGLYNRRYVEPKLQELATQARQARQPLAIMMIDIDRFKTINDRYGHKAGDRVLVQMAERLRGNLRNVDLLARIGGEEFLVAMPATTLEQARVAADRLRCVILLQPFDLGPDLPVQTLSISVGLVVGGPEHDGDMMPDSLCHSADAALYAAKSAGRNRVEIANSAA